MILPGFVRDFAQFGNKGRRSNWGWAALMLDFMEQSNVADSIGVNRQPLFIAGEDPEKLEVMQTPLPQFWCPSDGAVETTQRFNYRSLFTNSGKKPVVAASSYVAVNNYRQIYWNPQGLFHIYDTHLRFGQRHEKMSKVF